MSSNQRRKATTAPSDGVGMKKAERQLPPACTFHTRGRIKAQRHKAQLAPDLLVASEPPLRLLHPA